MMRKMTKMVLASVLGAVVLVGCSMGAKDGAKQEPQFSASVTEEVGVSSEQTDETPKDPHPPTTAEPIVPQMTDKPDAKKRPDPPTNVSPKSGFNNLSNCAKWGDEADFFRGAKVGEDVQVKTGEIMVVQAKAGELAFDETGGAYALLVHCHNGTKELLENVAISVTYPTVISDGSEAHVSIDANQLEGSLTASLALKTEKPLELQLSSDTVRVTVDDSEIRYKASGFIIQDKVMNLINLDLPKDADCTFAILIEIASDMV